MSASANLWRWLWSLERDPGPEGGSTRLDFTLTLPAWTWFLVIVAALALAAWSYRGIEAPRGRRLALAGLRGVLLIVLAVLLAGPRIVREREAVERDWVVALVDRSRSMTIQDAPAAPSTVPAGVTPAAQPLSLITREDELRAALADGRATWDALAGARTLAWMGFDTGAYDLSAAAAPSSSPGAQPVSSPAPRLEAPAGAASNLGAALTRALARAAGRPLAGIVVFSDGRSSDTVAPELLRRLAGEKIGVYILPLGAENARADYAVAGVEAPSAAFAGDFVPVRARITRSGRLEDAATLRVELIDDATGAVLDSRRVGLPAGAREPEMPPVLTGRPGNGAGAGTQHWSVRVRAEGGGGGAGPGEGDLVAENDRVALEVGVLDRPLRVLYVDGAPRWEYRYLKNVLARERGVRFAALLLAEGRRYVQEGSETLEALPSTKAEWDAWDVVIIGDVKPDVFSSEQLRLLRERVASGGAGLLWIAGEGAVPTAWRAGPLADLLPMTFPAGEAAVKSWDAEVAMTPTPAAESLGVLRLSDIGARAGAGETASAGEADLGASAPTWPPELSAAGAAWARLRWAQRLDAATLKPTAETLARFGAMAGSETGAPATSPAVITMRFGAGRIVYVATDEIWRWRYGRGEAYPERFYLQLLRLLGREAVSRSGRSALLAVEPRRVEVGENGRVSVRLIDQRLVDANAQMIEVTISKVDAPAGAGAGAPRDDRVMLRAESTPAGSPGADAGGRVYVGAWRPGSAGRYRARVSDALLSGAPSVEAEAEGVLTSDELRMPEADHALLRRIAAETGGAMLTSATIKDLPTLLPRREVRSMAVAAAHPLWDTPGALLLIVLLLSAEWIGRRLIRLP